MADGAADPPEVSRRRVRNILREARVEARLTQQEAADRVLWSLSKLIRVENGPSSPAPADVRVLMLEYGLSEQRVSECVDFAKAARQPDRWRTYRNVYAAESVSLFANEPAANVIYKHEPSLVPGLLQTEDYARALLGGLGVDPQAIESMVEVRLARQEMLEGPRSPALDFVLDEAAVSRPIGGHAVMRAQLEHLKQMAERPNITLRLILFAAGPHPGMGTAFTILSFRDPELPDLLYLESGEQETIVRDEVERVESYLRRFVSLQAQSSPPEEFPAQLDAIAANLFSN